MLNCKLNQLLKKQGKSQAWLAEVTGISTGMISQIASGRSIPTEDELSLICGVLLCRREELYDQAALQLITGTKPKEKKKRKTDSVRIPRGLTAIVDRYAGTYDISRNEAVMVMITASLQLLGYWIPMKRTSGEVKVDGRFYGVDFGGPEGSKTVLYPPFYAYGQRVRIEPPILTGMEEEPCATP